jgi:hypothetical protein
MGIENIRFIWTGKWSLVACSQQFHQPASCVLERDSPFPLSLYIHISGSAGI